MDWLLGCWLVAAGWCFVQFCDVAHRMAQDITQARRRGYPWYMLLHRLDFVMLAMLAAMFIACLYVGSDVATVRQH